MEVPELLFTLNLLIHPRVKLLFGATFPHSAGPAAWLG